MSIERRRLMLAYGASFELTPRAEGVKGAIAKANALAAGIADSWIPQQFENPANVEVHRRTTAQEILNDFRDIPIDVLITGVGTGGHITACAEVLKPEWPGLKVYRGRAGALGGALGRPSGAPSAPGPRHRLRAGDPRRLPARRRDHRSRATTPRRWPAARRARKGMLVGISSGACLDAIRQKLPDLPEGSRILGFNYDTGERYLSVPDFLPEE